MSRLTLAAAAAVLILSPGVVAAQTAAPQVTPAPPPPLNMSFMRSGAGAPDFFTQDRDDRDRVAIQRRSDRAVRAARLINRGDCAGALALARRDNDRRLATRITEVCAGES